MNRRFADDLETDLARGHVLEWAELYALDAISAEERTTIREFLRTSDATLVSEFSRRVRTCRETVVAAYAPTPLDPPGDLLDRILAQLPADDAGSGSPPDTPDAAEAPENSAARVPAARDELSERRTARTTLSTRAARWGVAAVAAAVLVIGGVTIAQTVQQTSLEEQVLEAQDVRTEQLPLDAGGTAEVAISGAEDAALVSLSGVPAPAEGFVYQMWRIPADGTAPVSVGTMTGDDVAGGTVTELPGISGLSAIAITVEPEGGSSTPTMPIVAQIPLGA
ncbi:anti-sigma factor [Arthrobacter echini]|nr:anti-sigma factor [Arthrobacter echini]